MLTRRRLPSVLIAFAVCAPVLAAPAEAQYVTATCQACTSSNDCESAPPVNVPNVTASLTRLWDSDGFHYSTNTNMTLDYVSFAIFARASGTETPEDGDPFTNFVARLARSIGQIDDVLTAGEGGAPGFFRIPLHLTGGVAIEWQNGSGSAALSLQCVSSTAGSGLAIGMCPFTLFEFSASEAVDTVVNLDVPIILGQPFEYRITVAAQAVTGHAYGALAPFLGVTEATFGSGAFAGASVLDSNHVVIPGAPISASASGFQYVPEPSSAIGGVSALIALHALRQASRRRSRQT